MLEVAIEIDPADPVFGDEPVAIGVHALEVDRVRPPLAFGSVGPPHDARLVRIDHERSTRVCHPHERHGAVLIQIRRAILVGPSIVVVVVCECVDATTIARPGEHGLGAVGIETWHDVDDVLIQLGVARA